MPPISPGASDPLSTFVVGIVHVNVVLVVVEVGGGVDVDVVVFVEVVVLLVSGVSPPPPPQAVIRMLRDTSNADFRCLLMNISLLSNLFRM